MLVFFSSPISICRYQQAAMETDSHKKQTLYLCAIFFPLYARVIIPESKNILMWAYPFIYAINLTACKNDGRMEEVTKRRRTLKKHTHTHNPLLIRTESSYCELDERSILMAYSISFVFNVQSSCYWILALSPAMCVICVDVIIKHNL